MSEQFTSPSTQELTGTVLWFNSEKGYGFLKPENGGEDIFVHHSNINVSGYASLNEGQQVSFELGSGPKGPTAINVQPR